MNAATRPAGPSRRNFLSVAGVGALALFGAGSLAACGQRTVAGVSNASDALLPTTIPLKAQAADIAGTADGVPSAFFKYPKAFRSVEKAPLNGTKITAITNLFGTAPNGRGSNPAWQAIEERLGGTVEITSVSSDDYDTKFNTVVAGGDLPDLMLNNGSAVKDTIEFLQAKCADLTPYLGGDKIAAYPNLAAIPEIFWKNTVQAGKIYSLPIPRNLTGGSGFVNQTMLEKVGVSSTADIKDKDDFYRVATALTDPANNQWALGSTKFGLTMLHHIFRTPNVWRNDGGKLTRAFETEEYLAAIEFAAKLYKDGLYVPGSEGWTKSQMVNAFIAGKVAMIYDGLPAYTGPTGYGRSLPAANPANKAVPFIPFGHDGGKAQTWLDNVTFGTVMLKQNDEAKLKEVLGVANFLAAPFGSEEYLLLNYGVEGTDYTLDGNGNPIATERGLLDTAVPWKYLAAPQQVVFDPSNKEIATTLHSAYSKLIPLGVANPCETLFSPTDSSQGSKLGQPVSDAATAFIAGRGDMAGLKAAIAAWKTSGGDTIRGEYEQALAS
ncbi:extracellular solute-binding protein [Arthrobacter sp. 35W]|uniref:extracellular solute-binding protein n=1 Tax=Arthrobacter sp. 35W TaxID=1132441 RepID=UPI0004004962|nr:extracellular solute-binding protein [Arthrobacter sp. 35W]